MEVRFFGGMYLLWHHLVNAWGMVTSEQATIRFKFPKDFYDVSNETLSFFYANSQRELTEKTQACAKLLDHAFLIFALLVPTTVALGVFGVYLALGENNDYDFLILLCGISVLTLLIILIKVVVLLAIGTKPPLQSNSEKLFCHKSFMLSRDHYRRFVRKQCELIQTDIMATLMQHRKRSKKIADAMHWLVALLVANAVLTASYFVMG